MASYSSMKQEVNVLLVEHDTNHLISVRQMLEFFSYKVKCVEYASTALSMLSNGKARFDIVMANINSPEDSCTFKLLQEAYKMDLLVILMCDNNDDMTARSALEVGAFLFLEKPITMENVMYLWQHVWRKKTWKIKEKERLREIVAYNTTRNGFVAEEEIPMENVKSDDKEVENGDESSKKARTRKVWAEWTQELHNKFVDAAIQLGEGKCYPEEILDLMNVPGLTRVQVASHLQKCRKGNWRPRKERKGHTVNIVASPKIEATKRRPRKYGSMPFLTKHSEQQNLQIQEDAEKIQDPQIYDPTNNNNTVFDNYPQLPQVEPPLDSSGCTFARDNVETPYTEQDGTNLQIEPDAFMPDDLFVFDFNSVTSGSLHADIDQLNYLGQMPVNPNMPTTD